MFDFLTVLLRRVLRAWRTGGWALRGLVLVALLLVLLGLVVGLAAESNYFLPESFGRPVSVILLTIGAAPFIILSLWEQITEEDVAKTKIENAEQAFRSKPDQPQLAWDLARTKLENYLDRNLSQLQSIYWLTTLVMVAGFGIVIAGLARAWDAPENFPVSIVASISGIIISFVGGSFLIIYRSILAQTQSYVAVLERINAVGMAVQVLGSIADEHHELRDQSTALLASQLINLYAIKH